MRHTTFMACVRFILYGVCNLYASTEYMKRNNFGGWYRLKPSIYTATRRFFIKRKSLEQGATPQILRLMAFAILAVHTPQAGIVVIVANYSLASKRNF